MKKENEIWKVIPNYENYEASNFGRIRSIDRVVKRDRYTTRKIKGKILQQFAKNSGYLQVNLSKNSKIETKTVHRLVAITFLENTNNYTDVNHKDENKHNNNINNLEWVSYRENTSHYNSLRNDTSSKFIGVSFTKGYNKWRSFISFKGKLITIGHFNTEIEAHNARINYENNNNIINKYS